MGRETTKHPTTMNPVDPRGRFQHLLPPRTVSSCDWMRQNEVVTTCLALAAGPKLEENLLPCCISNLLVTVVISRVEYQLYPWIHNQPTNGKPLAVCGEVTSDLCYEAGVYEPCAH